jgi:hypothetical protein
MTAIPVKHSTRRWDCNPRIVRKKPEPITIDDPEAHLRFADERTFRNALWLDFARYARSYGGIVISRPSVSPVTVLVGLGDGEDSPLEIALRSLPKYSVIKLPGTMMRLSHAVFVSMRPIEIRLWPRG